MKYIIFLTLLVVASCSINGNKYKLTAPKPPEMGENTDKQAEPIEFITAMTQLTFAGKRAGEGYFSADGSQLVFQSERLSDNPFYQIFKMDLALGDVEMVSNGIGKTTCAWIHADGEQILYASTHLDTDAKLKQEQELAFRASGQQRRYAWDYDENYDIFIRDKVGTRQITTELGYDAEGNFSPDGKWIVFASNRNAYNENASNMTEQDKKIFVNDAAYMMDIYLMRADGSEVKQLTTHLGYDGGPFFSPDGKKIVWRRFNANGVTAEIFTMNTDGTEKKQLTHTGNMSWAPFFHPSQKYIIYTTNIHGFSNFELYIVDVDGEQQPVRVSDLAGFDGLPVFTPQGDQLYWTRKPDNNDVSQIYRANWNHQAALQALKLH